MTSVEPSSAPNLGGGVDAPSAAIEHDAAPAPDVIDPNERVLEIPIRNELGEESDEVIYVSVNGLPDDVDKVVDVLKAERADLWRWLAFAVEYYRQQRTQQFERILTEGCSSEVDLYYTDDTKGRIALLNAYAAFKISQGKAEWTRDRNVSERLLTDAVEFLNRADRINNMADATWVNKGGLNMVRGHHGNAIRDFSNALEINPDNLMGLLGKGAVLFERKQFREARDHYIRAIRSHPGCSAAVRVALGLCFLELKQPQRAVEAFERAHELEPDNVDALVALSVLELGNAAKGSDASNHVRQEATRKLLQSAMSRLQRAFELEPSNSIVLNHLANHFFMKETRDHSRIENLVRKAYRSTTHERVQAEACYMLGRSAHAQANLDVAAKFYDQSLSHWPGFPLAKFNRAQLLVSTARTPEDIARVIKLLEELNGEPNLQNESDISYMLGSLYAAQGQHEKATVMLVRATEARPDNSDAWVEYAQLLQQGSTKVKWKEALRAWGKVAGILMQEGKVVPAELFCNQGVLQYKLGEKDEAMDCLYFALLADRKQHGGEWLSDFCLFCSGWGGCFGGGI
jgi:RNA polymerase-associated protein CTR9